MFSIQRDILKKLFAHEPKVVVDSWTGLIVEYARQNKISSIVRGLRPTGDFEIEFQIRFCALQLFCKLSSQFITEHEFIWYKNNLKPLKNPPTTYIYFR